MKSWFDFPAIFRDVNRPLAVWQRLNVTLGHSVWRPRNTVFESE